MEFTQLTLLAVPFITSGIMFVIKWLAGLYMTDNGPDTRPWLRVFLVLISMFGYVATAQISNTPIDPNIVSQDVTMFLSTGVLAYLAHAFYNSAFRT
jgi:hypothetical protein